MAGQGHFALYSIVARADGFVMSRASGLIHFSNGDRNPRVLYEALMFGLPVMVSIQSMPYIGLQCQPFVTPLCVCGVRFHAVAATTHPSIHAQDTNGTSAEVTAHLRRFVKYLTDSESQGRPTQDSEQRDHRTALAPQKAAQRPIGHPNFCGGRINGAFCVRELLPAVRDLRVAAIGEGPENTMGQGREM